MTSFDKREQRPRCESCAYFESDNDRNGECRKNAPIVAEMKGGDRLHGVFWPGVQAGDWCGEYVTNIRRSSNGVESDVRRSGRNIADVLRHLVDAVDEMRPAGSTE
jgi:hypothetical protein